MLFLRTTLLCWHEIIIEYINNLLDLIFVNESSSQRRLLIEVQGKKKKKNRSIQTINATLKKGKPGQSLFTNCKVLNLISFNYSWTFCIAYTLVVWCCRKVAGQVSLLFTDWRIQSRFNLRSSYKISRIWVTVSNDFDGLKLKILEMKK